MTIPVKHGLSRSTARRLLHRAPHHEAFWQGVTGAVEPGETILEAARRELREETGYTADGVVALDYTCTFPVAASWHHVYGADVVEIREHTFLVEVPGTTEPWIDPSEARCLAVVLRGPATAGRVRCSTPGARCTQRRLATVLWGCKAVPRALMLRWRRQRCPDLGLPTPNPGAWTFLSVSPAAVI